MAGYIRQSNIADGNTIDASLFNNEFDELLAAFVNTSGHQHDGTAANGPVIGLIGDAGLITPLNKIFVDTTNKHLEFNINVGGSSVEQFKIQDGAIVPTTDNDIDLGTSTLEFKNAYFDGNVTLDGLVIGSATAITDVDIDLNAVSASDDTLASAKAIKTYVDAQVTASDLDFSGDAGGSQEVDLDSQSLTLTGGTGIDTTGSAQTMTFAIDTAVVVDKTTSQVLTNKTLTSPVLNTSISGTAFLDEDNMSSNSDTKVASQQSIKAYVDSQIDTTDTLSEILAIGNTTGGTDIQTTTTDKILFRDSAIHISSSTDGHLNLNADTEVQITSPYIDLAAASVSMNGNLDVDGIIEFDAISGTGAVTVTDIADEDNMSSNSATKLATQQSIKAYVDTQVATVPVGDITSVIAGAGMTGGGVSGDVTLNVIGGTGITANANDIAIDNTVATLIGTQTLINKSINSDNNTITNIVNADIKSAAAIDATKIANGSISNTEFQYLNGVTSAIQSQLNTKATAGFAVAMAIAL